MQHKITGISLIAIIVEMVNILNNLISISITIDKINIAIISICCINNQHQTITKKETKKVDAEIQKRGILLWAEPFQTQQPET